MIARNESLQVSWTPPEEGTNSPITEYRVLWRRSDQDFNDSSCSLRRVSVPSDGDLIAVVGPLRNGATYHIQIFAVSDDGPGAAVEISGAPAAIPGPPRAVGAFSVDGGLLVDWDAPWDGGSPITGYRVQWKGSGEDYNDSDRMAMVGALSLSHEITGLANGSEYTVRVLAISNDGTSRVSQTGPCPDIEPGRCDGYVAEATGTPGDAPGPPRSAVALVNDAPTVRCDATVTWEAPTDAGGSAITSYRLQWKLAWENHYSELVEITDLARLSYTLVLNYWPLRGTRLCVPDHSRQLRRRRPARRGFQCELDPVRGGSRARALPRPRSDRRDRRWQRHNTRKAGDGSCARPRGPRPPCS